MKKILKYTGITLGVIFLLLLIAPFLFKGKIVDAVKQAANDNLNASVNFDDVSLSLIRNFPNLRLTIENLTVTNNAPFDSVQLAKIGDLIAVVDIMSVFGDEIQVKKIGIVDPSFDIRVLADGTANYDIAKEDTTATAVEEAPADTAASTFKMKLKEYYIENGNIRYEDKTTPMLMEIFALNHSGTGDFTQDLFVLPTITSAEKINFIYDGVQYMNEAKAQIDMKLEMDMKKMKFTISENKILLNALELAANGWVEMPEEDIDIDFSFAATKTDFKNLLSMVPAAFAKDLDGVDVSGKMGLEGYVRGTYNEESLPGVGLDILVENGRFKYPDLPKSVDNIQIKTSIKADLNVMDNTTVDVSKFHLEMAKNPVDMTLKLRTPESDPDIDFNCKAFVDLDNLKEFIPLENNDEVHGQINIDATLKGRMSSVEKEQYDQFYADGLIDIKNVLFTSDSLPYDVQVNQATFHITPAYLDMPSFDSKIGRSDLKANGKITDYLAYALRDSLLIGSFNVSSNLLDLNEFMSEEEAPATAEKPADAGAAPAPEEALAPIELPGNIDFNLNASFAKMIYDKTEITNVKGGIGLKDKIASLKNLSMNVLEGTVMMAGNYNAQNLELPKMDFLFDIKDMNINKAAVEFNTIDKLAPVAKSCTGKFSTKMNIKSDLGQDMMPINPTVNGKGTLSTKGVQIKDFAPLVKLAEKINLDKFKNPKLSDVNVAFKIVDGVVNVDPFTVKIDDVPAKVYGSTTLDQVIDYNVEMDIPFEKFPSNVVNKAGSFIGDLNKKLGTNVSIGNKVNVIARITGTITDPKIGVTSKALGESAVQDLKQQVVEEVKKEIKEQVTNLKNEALEKAIAEKQRLAAEAQKQADRAKSEAQQAAQQAKDAAYKLASDTEKSARNPLEKAGKKLAADKIRKEADEAYNKAIAEANKRADKLVTDANAKGDKLIQDANAAGDKQINK
ncbi:MAG: AsmA-like C-terminal region-containing protein [Flavobacteriales bacterium]